MENKIVGISHFWIIHKSSGITIFSQQFDDRLLNIVSEDLIGGFIIAIMGFAKEIANQKIELMRLSELTLHYNIKENFIMVALTTNSVDSSRIRILLDHVQDRFNTKYEKLIQAKFITNIAIFHDFAKITEEIFEAETQYLTIIRSRATTIEEYFQQASKDWAALHEKIIEQSHAFSTWGEVNLIKVNKVIQKDLLVARKKYYQMKENKKNITHPMGSWI